MEYLTDVADNKETMESLAGDLPGEVEVDAELKALLGLDGVATVEMRNVRQNEPLDSMDSAPSWP